MDLVLSVSLGDLSHRIIMLNVMPETYQYAVPGLSHINTILIND